MYREGRSLCSAARRRRGASRRRSWDLEPSPGAPAGGDWPRARTRPRDERGLQEGAVPRPPHRPCTGFRVRAPHEVIRFNGIVLLSLFLFFSTQKMKCTAPSDFLPRRVPSDFSVGDPGMSSLEVRCPEVDGLGKGSCVVEPAGGGCSPVPDSPTLTYSKIPEEHLPWG